MEEQVLLSAPKGDGRFVIVCDASDYGIGAALLQLQGDELVVLEFGSKTLSSVEKNWHTFGKEAFAIRWAVERFADYIRTGNILVLTDSKNLEWMCNSTKGKVRRWSLYLQQFDLEIKHISGQENGLADWLSRSVDESDDLFNDMEDVEIPQFNIHDDSPVVQEQ